MRAALEPRSSRAHAGNWNILLTRTRSPRTTLAPQQCTCCTNLVLHLVQPRAAPAHWLQPSLVQPCTQAHGALQGNTPLAVPWSGAAACCTCPLVATQPGAALHSGLWCTAGQHHPCSALVRCSCMLHQHAGCNPAWCNCMLHQHAGCNPAWCSTALRLWMHCSCMMHMHAGATQPGVALHLGPGCTTGLVIRASAC